MIRPPRLAQKLFDWYSNRAQVDDLRGDLDEWFHHHLQSMPVWKAKLLYWKQALSLLFSYTMRKRKRDSQFGQYHSTQFSLDMLRSYLKVAVRNLYQYRYFSLINAFGLAMGMSISLLLIAMYSFISTYDTFHRNGDNIRLISTERTEGMDHYFTASAPVALAESFKEEFTGAKEVVRINSTFDGNVKNEREDIPLRGYFVDANFLSVFSFELIAGNAWTALQTPNTVALSESAAIKIFGTRDVVGKSIEFAPEDIFTVTAVLKDQPKNTHFEFEALASYASLPPSEATHEQQWTRYANQYVYILLDNKSTDEDLERYLSVKAASEYKNTRTKVSFTQIPITEIVTKDLTNSIGPQWELTGFVVFGVLALIILLPGIFNYTNISIARALKRSKEIGLRKTMGGIKSQIFFQFITETVVITLVSLGGAILIFYLIRGEFQSMLVDTSALDLSITPRMFFYFLAFALIVGFMAGAFPALHFASLNPISALKGRSENGVFTASGIRKGLSIFQFSLSFCFILCLVVFSRQYHQLVTFDFGFKKENIVNVELQGVDAQLFKNEFAKVASVESVTLSSGTLGVTASSTWLYKTDAHDSLQSSQLFADADYLKVFNLELVAGETLPETARDERFILVNEKFTKAAGCNTPQEALGKTYLIDGKEMVVRGVLRNFHFGPPQVPIGNFIFRSNAQNYTQANMKVDVGNVYTAFATMEKAWKTLAGNKPFEVKFFEEELNEAYVSYRSILVITGGLGLFALTISILGLLGMVVYTVETRMKEVSIRKVLGASTSNLMIHLSKDYLKLIIWAIAFGLLVTILAFQLVFSRIPNYQAHLETVDVVIGILLLLLLGVGTISTQTYQAATSNPAETLKCE